MAKTTTAAADTTTVAATETVVETVAAATETAVETTAIEAVAEAIETPKEAAMRMAQELLNQYIALAQKHTTSLDNGKTIPHDLLDGFKAVESTIKTLHGIGYLV